MNLLKNNDLVSLGNNFFLAGIFFLPSALPISILFLLSAIIISFRKSNFHTIKDKLNYPLFISIGLIIFSTINLSFIKVPTILIDYNISLAWLNLFNWLPAFFLYWGFQFYLCTKTQRIRFAQALISGCFPVLLSFVLQKYFNLFGPFATLNGLIVWFQRTGQSGVSGLFSNPNYAGNWLALSLPFSLFLLQREKSQIFRKIILIIFCISIVIGILITSSRNALLGVIIATLMLYGFRKSIFIFLFSMSTFFATNLIIFLINGGTIIKEYLIPNKLIDKLLIFDYPRLAIWLSALSRIKERPLLGWGPSTFPLLHKEYNNAFFVPKEIVLANHSHNIAFELAHNFGIPLAIILIITIFLIIIRSLKYIYKEYESNEIFLLNKAWLASSLIAISSHLTDITYYDGKISILICTIFAGLKCISNK